MRKASHEHQISGEQARFSIYFLTEHTLKHALSWPGSRVQRSKAVCLVSETDLGISKINRSWIKNICEQNKDIPKDWLFKHFKIQEGWIIYDYNVLFLFFTKTLLSREWEVLFLIEKVNLL